MAMLNNQRVVQFLSGNITLTALTDISLTYI
jgi:hypothetical protein